jgi:glutathione S-transferase
MKNLPKMNVTPTPDKTWNSGIFKIIKVFINSCSTTTRQRNPPSDGKTQHVRLVTIGPSHYCEKARWALDMLDNDPVSPIYYTENAHPPLFQSLETLTLSDGKVSMVPMVELTNQNGEKEVMHDSAKIVEFFLPHLYPSSYRNEILELEEYSGQHIGATARCYLYHVSLKPKYYKFLTNMLTSQSSSVEKMIWGTILDRGIAKGMKKVMGINSHSAEASLAALRKAFNDISLKLTKKDGSKKKFILDTDEVEIGFTAADLAFCSTASVIVCPPELSLFMPMKEDEMPPELLNLRNELRNTFAGKHVLDVYKYHRGKVMPKVVNRDCFPIFSRL